MEENKIDDGSLAFLGIEEPENSRSYHEREIRLHELMNREFLVLDFLDGIKTKYGEDRFLVKIKIDNEGRKFFTNSAKLKYTLEKIKEMKAFPRKVTLHGVGKNIYFK